MQPILSDICSIKEICSDCPFRRTITEPKVLAKRSLHLAEMQWDIMYRPLCESTRIDKRTDNSPMCRGALVYLVKKNKAHAILSAAIEQGVINPDELMKEAPLVID